MNEKVSTEAEAHALNKGAVMCRTCKNCGHRRFDECMLSGYYCTTERKMPTICGINFDGWKPRTRLGLKKWLLSLWYGT